MLTANHFVVSWCYREGDRPIVRRTLYHSTAALCIEAARIISTNPYTSEVTVLEVDSGRLVEWVAPGIGRVVCDAREGECVYGTTTFL